MPFTFSHPVIVLPLSHFSKRWVSMTGLTVGSIVPDFEYFLRMKVKSTYSHTLPGLFWFDLPFGLLLVFIYQILIKDSVIQHLPMALNQRFSRFKGVNKAGSLLLYFFVITASVLIGAISHIIWDGFTHSNGYFVRLLPVLSDIVQLGSHQLFVYKIIQHSSSIIGAIVIILVVYALPLGNPKRNQHIIGFWFQIIMISIIVFAIRVMTGLSYHQYGNVIVTLIAGGFIGLVITSLTTNLQHTK